MSTDGFLDYGTWNIPYVRDAKVDRLNIVSLDIHIPRKNPVDYSFLDIRKAPKLVPLPCVGATCVFSKGMHVIVYSYDGKTDPASYDSTPAEIIYELKGTDQDSAIETHPQFLALVKTYGGSYNPSDGSFTGFPYQRKGGKPGEKSSMYGVDSYLDVSWVWTKSYTSGAFPIQATRNVGCIDTPDFGLNGPVSLQNVRDYLKLAPTITKRGNVYAVTESWRAGGRNGINRDVYRTTSL